MTYENETVEIDRSKVAVLPSGSVQYALEEAVTEIDELIELLESAKSEGATHVTMSSGNHRGAQWAGFGYSPMYDWADNE